MKVFLLLSRQAIVPTATQKISFPIEEVVTKKSQTMDD